MHSRSRRTFAAGALAGSALGLTARGALAQAQSQAYPTRPIQIVVPFPPGGSSDAIGRQLAPHLAASLNGNVVIDNRPGAGTLIATQHVANAAPDGHTFLLVDVPFSVNPTVVKAARYDPVKDFVPVALLGASAQFLYSSPTRYASLADFIAAAKASPGRVSVANAGNGTTTHLMTVMMQGGLGIELLPVQYKGSAPALTDTAAGHADGAFSTLASAAPLVSSGKLKVLGVTSEKRLPALPDVPTFAEVGARDMVVEHWWGLVAPAGTPAAIVERVNQAVAAALAQPDVLERFKALGVEARTGTPAAFGQTVASYVERWAKVAKQYGIEAN